MANEEKPKVENITAKGETGNKAVPTGYNAEEAVTGGKGRGDVVLATNGGFIEQVRVSPAAAEFAQEADALIREKLDAYDEVADVPADYTSGANLLANDQQVRYDAERERYNREAQEYYRERLKAEQEAVAAANDAVAGYTRRRPWIG